MSEQSAGIGKKIKARSPSYPGIHLEAAIQRAREVYDRDRQHTSSVETIAKHWGYKSLNGPASVTLAALKKFGLLDDEGVGPSRTARVSDLAVTILAHPDLNHRAEAVRRAALKPTIHQELWEKYRADLPSDANLRWELTRSRGFSETGADELIPEYRHTIAFAQLAPSSTVETQTPEEQSEDDADDEQEPPFPPRRPRKPRRMTESSVNVLMIPLASGAPVILEGDFPISERDWLQMMNILAAMKPGLVRDEAVMADDED